MGDITFLVVVKGPHLGERLRITAEEGFSPAQGFLASHSMDFDRESQTGLTGVAGESVFLERAGASPRLIIFGGGHVSQALMRCMKALDFEIIVVDDRPELEEKLYEAGAHDVRIGDFSDVAGRLSPREDDYFVVMTRGHSSDGACLEAILKRPFAYVGMMASKKRGGMMRETLLSKGLDPEAVARLHTPIGLSIGAETPEEIAVSVAAELISVRRQSRKATLMPEEVAKVLSDGNDTRCKVLCTIVDKHGSAPRSVGTKMLVCGDGTNYGTVGGGTAEWKVIQAAREMCAEWSLSNGPVPECRLVSFVMNSEELRENDMACGGTVQVFLEPVTASKAALLRE